MRVGYRRALPFLAGLFAGFTLVMGACAVAAGGVLAALPSLERVLRFAGAAYVLWLAWTTWRARRSLGTGAARPADGFAGGVLLPFLNAKLVVYGLLLYSTFLAALRDRPAPLAASVLLLAVVSFAANTAWALAGAAAGRRLRTERQRTVAAALLAVALVWTALQLSGVTGGAA